VFARVVGRGLEGQQLLATYRQADKLEYQDALGQLMLGVAHTVPDGLLLFLPSYALMDKLHKRWQVCVCATSVRRVGSCVPLRGRTTSSSSSSAP
jgi:Fanconi anemia group J protein